MIVRPGLRDHDHHCQRQRHPVHNQKLQRIVCHRGVRAFRINDRQHLCELVVQFSGGHRLLAGKHLIRITTNRIDLTVMNDKTVRMRALPTRICVRTETGMYHRDRRLVIRILQIIEEQPQLIHQKHSFIYDRTAGK